MGIGSSKKFPQQKKGGMITMQKNYAYNLIQTVINLSEADNWEDAVEESKIAKKMLRLPQNAFVEKRQSGIYIP